MDCGVPSALHGTAQLSPHQMKGINAIIWRDTGIGGQTVSDRYRTSHHFGCKNEWLLILLELASTFLLQTFLKLLSTKHVRRRLQN